MTDKLIIYYSSTGYNQRVANLIAQKTGADVFEVQPVKEYDKNMWAAWDVAKKEREDNNLPALKTGYPDMSKYKQVFLGGPSWGFTVSNPLQSFLKKADFVGNDVYPWVTYYDHDEQYLADLKKQLHNGQVHDLLELTMGTLNNQNQLEQTIDHWLAQI